MGLLSRLDESEPRSGVGVWYSLFSESQDVLTDSSTIDDLYLPLVTEYGVCVVVSKT